MNQKCEISSMEVGLLFFFFYLKTGYFWGIVLDTIWNVQEASVHVYNVYNYPYIE